MLRAIALTVLVVLLGIAGTTLASELEESHVGVVIYFDAETIEYHVIKVESGDMTGLDLLLETEHDFEVQPFGGLGEAICAIDDTGCPGSDCFCESYSSPAYFWNFYLLQEGQWVPQHRGAGQHTVEPGEIHGWAWTAGAPDLPEVSFDELTEMAADDPEPTPQPEVSPTPIESTDDSIDDENDSDGASDTKRCLQFIGALSLIAGMGVIVGKLRYGRAGSG